MEDWLLAVANARGARVVVRAVAQDAEVAFEAPPREVFSDEELVTGILLLCRRDVPQLLRPAAQLVSRGHLDIPRLLHQGRKERTCRSLKMLALQALHVDPDHAAWREVLEGVQEWPEYSQPLIHWTRLAEPRMRRNAPGAEAWVLVS